jgi:hypothetical protein
MVHSPNSLTEQSLQCLDELNDSLEEVVVEEEEVSEENNSTKK